MKTRKMSSIDKPVSELVLGSAWFLLEDKSQHFALLDRFVEYGGTAIDTARIYGDGEEVIGRWMRERGNRERMFVITKGGLSKANPNALDDKIEKTIAADVTASLKDLKTDYVDLYFLHRDKPSIPVGRIVEALNAELARGRIRAFGGSNWHPSRVDEANRYAREHNLAGFAAVSNNLSLAVPTGPYYEGLIGTDDAAKRWHSQTGIPLFAWSAQARGFFTGRFRPDVRDNPDMVRVYYTEENFERLRRAEKLGTEKGDYSAVEVALAWVLHQPFDVFPLIGPHTVEELESCIKALEIKLTEQEVRWLDLED